MHQSERAPPDRHRWAESPAKPSVLSKESRRRPCQGVGLTPGTGNGADDFWLGVPLGVAAGRPLLAAGEASGTAVEAPGWEPGAAFGGLAAAAGWPRISDFCPS